MRDKISRREFLQLSAGSCLAMSMPPLMGCAGDDDDDDDNDTAGAPDPHDHEAPEQVVGGRTMVHVVTGDSLSEIFGMARESMVHLGITKNSLRGAKVFIKPNFVSLGLGDRGFLGDGGECTKADIVAAVAEQCLEAGARHVVIGEGGQGKRWDWNTVTFLPGNTFHGARNLAEARDYLNTKYGDNRVRLVCLNLYDKWKLVPSCSDDPALAEGLPVARDWYDADHVISLPVIKSHIFADFTACLKNYVGIVPIYGPTGCGFVRQKMHAAYAHATCAGVPDVGVAGAFLDAQSYRVSEGKVDFGIVDCTIGVESSGPHLEPMNGGLTIDLKARTPMGKYFMLAGQDLAATDYVASKVMNFGPLKQLIVAKRLGLSTFENIMLSGANLDDLVITDWKKPYNIPEDFFIFLDKLVGRFFPQVDGMRLYRQALRQYSA
jgi:uncharacterized protein (DUF362 family)